MGEADVVYLVTGANRGIGRHLVGELLARDSVTLVAAVRNVDDETATSLLLLPVAESSKLHVLALNEKEPSIDSKTLPDRLQEIDITRLDVVVSNAGGSVAFRSVVDARAAELLSDYETNVLAPLGLFQACWPLLKKSDGSDARRKKFVYVSSTVGSIGVQMMEHFPSTGYGTSKAAGNWLAVAIALEHKRDGLKTGIFHPGFVATGLGKQAAVVMGMEEEPPMAATDSGAALLKHIDALNMERSGTFDSCHGEILPW
jgi:norsolorinic acid ketoreductase